MENDNVLAILRRREFLAALAHFRRRWLLFLLSMSPFLFHARRHPVVETRIKLSTGVRKVERREDAFSAFSDALIVAAATSGRQRVITHLSGDKPVLSTPIRKDVSNVKPLTGNN